jgi:hypothetical protein
MIVYGDPQFTTTTAEMLALVREPTHPGRIADEWARFRSRRCCDYADALRFQLVCDVAFK